MHKRLDHTMILATVIVMDLLAGMEFDLFVPSFTQLQHHFSVSAFWLEALLSVNFIGYCISLFAVGTLADRLGRRPVILWGLLIFVSGSLLCALIDSYDVILVGRFLQGLGVGAPSILSFIIIADCYPLEKQQFYMAILNGVMNIAVGIAPVVGSMIALYFHWQGNFLALLVLGVLTLLMTFLFIPRNASSPNSSATLFAGYRALFQSRPLLLLIGAFVSMCVPYWLFVGISPLLYIKSLHVSLPTFGLYQGVLALTFGVGSIAFGFIVNRCPQKTWLMGSLYLFIVSLIVMTWVVLSGSLNPKLITLAMLVLTIAEIIPSIILYPLCLSLMPDAKAKISAVIQAARLILTAVGLEISGYFYNGTFQNTGMMIAVLIVLIIVTQYAVLKNKLIVSRCSGL